MDFGMSPPPECIGTTIVAVEFDGGVVMGADSRTSCGNYIANRISDKLTRVHDSIYCCRSGSAADTQAMADLVAFNLNLQEMTTDEVPLVIHAAHHFRMLGYQNRATVTAGIIVGGWDAKDGGQVYEIPLGGMVVRRPFAIGGSGGVLITGYMRESYRKGMTKDECVEMLTKGIKHSMALDIHSGGVIRIGIITKDGIERKVFYNTATGEPTVKTDEY